MAKAKKQERERMPFITESLSEVHEPQAAPEGEYDLRIIKASRGESKKGNDMITAWLAFQDGGLEAPPFAHYLLGWDGDTDPDQKRNRQLEIKRFCACFDLAEDFEVEDLKGAEGTAFVTQEEGDDNVVRNRMRLPKLKE